MTEKRYTVIKLPEWDGWRVAGSGNDWQIQVARTRAGNAVWDGVKFYGAVEWAVGEAYERTLRELGSEYKSLAEFVDACHDVKKRLVAEVKRAAKETGR